MSERRPLTGREYTSILSLVGSLDAMTDAIPGLERRGQTEALKAALDTGAEALKAICDTVPLKKLARIQQDMRHTRIYTKVEAPGIRTIDTEHHRYVPARVLNQLVDYVAQHECFLCDKTDVEARRCPIKEMMEEALPHELAYRATDGKCRWSGVVLGTGEWED